MSFTKSSNPAFTDKIFAKARYEAYEDVMTVSGTVNKIALMLLLVVSAASYTWGMYFESAQTGGLSTAIMPWMIGGGVAGFVLALVTIFKPVWSPFTAPIYAVCEGLLLGGLSASFNAIYPGIVMQAVGLTFAILFMMLFAYKSGLIKVNEKFRTGIIAATGGIFIFYMVSWILGMFGVNMGFAFGNSLVSIGISLFVVAIASLNLVLDFDFIEKGAQQGAPKYMEWYGAFGIMVTLIWLYLEILRLLSKISSRN
ncbi:hypothetical protein DWB61_06905 [Ancylomarina euxinus]|uniref:Bax inhibitor-1/YccA family protein n=1 Tax=Ancylomarina euxinus TaxID=2283627 RepID=A0A425Y3J9_9BACT|nr:Bax inhibitor-1/YccA family protein [Ancylomarina euxinus]MCZ4693201.1 Bax inhibitor-1/YccA family protein [Ancylomarina euxinus]MUP15337.1 hypothetical protein [Ancylomarina euxinus]RRG22536.1 hypothetical protein DWB61_06905 [Ancylomarina euxinus]